jgi:hypothetical protein
MRLPASLLIERIAQGTQALVAERLEQLVLITQVIQDYPTHLAGKPIFPALGIGSNHDGLPANGRMFQESVPQNRTRPQSTNVGQ